MNSFRGEVEDVAFFEFRLLEFFFTPTTFHEARAALNNHRFFFSGVVLEAKTFARFYEKDFRDVVIRLRPKNFISPRFVDLGAALETGLFTLGCLWLFVRDSSLPLHALVRT